MRKAENSVGLLNAAKTMRKAENPASRLSQFCISLGAVKSVPRNVVILRGKRVSRRHRTAGRHRGRAAKLTGSEMRLHFNPPPNTVYQRADLDLKYDSASVFSYHYA
jgi:hypothetical protein